MQRALATLLLVVGVGLTAFALWTGVREIQGLYTGLVADPLAEPEVAEEDRSGRILMALLPAAAGVPLTVIGTGMLWRARIKRITGRRRL